MFTSRLLNARAQFGKPKGAVIGSDRSTMLLTSATRARLKTVAKLPGGTLTVNGMLTAAGGGAVSIAVVAGTGVFAGARGTLTILAAHRPEDGSQHLPSLLRADRLSRHAALHATDPGTRLL